MTKSKVPAAAAAKLPVTPTPKAKVKAKLDPKPTPKPGAKPSPKPKLVRDSFTIPKAEYELLAALKARAIDLKRPTRKSELLRAGIAVLNAMTDKALLAALARVTSLKAGRPKATPAEPKE